MTDKDKLKKAICVIKTIKQDARLAINGTWDKENDGFEAQITLIDRFLAELKKSEEPRGKLEQIKMDI